MFSAAPFPIRARPHIVTCLGRNDQLVTVRGERSRHFGGAALGLLRVALRATGLGETTICWPQGPPDRSLPDGPAPLARVALDQLYAGLDAISKVPEGTGANGHVLKVTSPTSASAELENGGQARLVFQVEATGPGQS